MDNKEELKELSNLWYMDNKEELKELSNLWYMDNKEELKELFKKVSTTNFGKRLEDPMRRSLKNWQHPGMIATDDKNNAIIFPEVQELGILRDYTKPKKINLILI